MNTTDNLAGQLASVALACADASPYQQSAVLDRAWKAVFAVPTNLRTLILPDFLSAGRFAQLIAARAHETAAIEMLGSGLGYIASRSPDGQHIATVIGPAGREYTETADTLALGLAAGLLRLVQAFHQEDGGQALVRH